MSNQIFISYKRQDKEFALKLAKDLKAAGINIWIDQMDIPPGEPWDNAVEKALDFCNHFMVILSPASVKSERVKDEIAYAQEERKLIIPVVIKECKIPLRIRRLNYIDFTSEHDSGLTKLLEYLKGGKVSQKQKKLKPAVQNEENESQPESGISSQMSSSEWFDLAEKSEDVNEKIKLFSNAIELNPENADYFNNRGDVYYALEQYDKAIEDYSKAIELNPENADYFNNRGNVYYNLGHYNEAIKDYCKAIELNHKYANAFYNRGNVYYALEQFDKAIEDYCKAIELNPDDADYFNNKGLAFYNLGQHNEAIKNYSKAIKLNQEYANAFYNRGLANRDMNKNKNASTDFNRYLKLGGNKEEDAEEVRQWIRDLGFSPQN
jgi:tetratricopeptide (TPR) repeat protein